ncbi:MAG: SMC-Scp complex subunit ScpB [Verrucomicrobiota bacterium]
MVDAEESEEEAIDYSPEESKAASEFTQVNDEQVVKALQDLNHAYETTGRAFQALERAKGWKIYTSPTFAGFVKHLFPGRRPKRLSAPAMETLAVIAYRQPVTKAAIDAVRGVSSDGMLQKLLDLELIKITGRAELPGRPLLYGTTDFFFEHFGIKSPEELPNAQELRRVNLPEPEPEAEAIDSPKDPQQLPLAEPTDEAPEPVPSVPAEDFATPSSD